MRQAGNYSGAYVVDLTTGATLFSHDADTPRLPASVEKLYTTTTALTRFGADAHLSTTVLGVGQQAARTFDGTLYLRGGGDPTFGSAGYDRDTTGPGRRCSSLVANLISATGIRALRGNDRRRRDDTSTPIAARRPPATGRRSRWRASSAALAYNRGWADANGIVLFAHPAL